MPIIITCVWVCACVCASPACHFYSLSSHWICLYIYIFILFRTSAFSRIPSHYRSTLFCFMFIAFYAIALCMWLFFFSSFPFQFSLSTRLYRCSISYMSCQRFQPYPTTSWHIKFFNVFLSVTSTHGQYPVKIHFPPMMISCYLFATPRKKNRRERGEWMCMRLN